MNSPQKERGAFLRRIREQVSPEALGIPAGPRRRTPGLKREEVAERAGISSTWYTWIEQGRSVQVSDAVLSNLADLLRMSEAQRNYLFELSSRPGKIPACSAPEEIPPILMKMIEEMPMPAYVLGSSWDALGWNPLAQELFPGWLTPDSLRKNLLEFMFLDPGAKELVVDWMERANRLVSDFRADCGHRLEEAALSGLVDRLAAESSDFKKIWKETSVSWREVARKDFNHPVRGHIAYEQATFRLVDRRDLKITLLRPIAL